MDTAQPLTSVQDWLALLPPQPVRLSPMQIRLLLRVVLVQPAFDRPAVVALLAYQQRHKQAAYLSHRRRRLRAALAALQPAVPAALRQGTLSPPRAPTPFAPSTSFLQGGSVSL